MDLFFFKKDSVNSLISICLSDLKDQKLSVSAIQTKIDNNRPKILLAWRAHKWSRQLACSNGQIKILRTIFEKGHQRNIPVKLFQNLTSSFGEEDFLRISLCPFIVQEDPIHQSHVFGRIKISQTIFEKGHPRNIPAKLFQNVTSGFEEEDFLRISSCPYSARSPHSPEPCLWTDQNLATNFLKRSPMEHSCKIISKSDQWFRRRFFKNFFMSN